ncbi:MAG: group II intron reverse transcriptase domain-containing protein [Elusimicrobia bacterium]|nr:group II intron reverse transcriptase domain-containing protein [Elusimicrobiota bacterium]
MSLKNLLRAANATLSEGRRFRGEGALFKFNLERELLRLHHQLITGRYRHGCYRFFTILDPKQRIVAAATVKDRVVHHAVHDVIEPLLDGMFIHDSYACRRGKGTHAALDRAHGFLRLSRYGLHLDVKSYFQSIDHEILKALLRRYVADEKARELIEWIVDSTNDRQRKGSRMTSVTATPPVAGQLELNLRPSDGDNRVGRACGLPLGNLTSQFYANLYLNELDQYVKHELKVRRYVRYMDDMLMFADEKASLLEWEKAVRDFARRELSLELHPAGGPRPVGRGIGFLGFRRFPGYRKLKKTSVSRFIRRMNGYSRDYVRLWPDRARRAALRVEIQQSTRSFHAHALNGNTYRIRKRLYDRFPLINQYALAGMKERWRGFDKRSR